MSDLRPSISPFLHRSPLGAYRRIIEATPEQKAEALELTREGAKKIRDLCRELELPATAFDSVTALYMNQEWGVVQKAEDARERAAEAKRGALVKQLRDKGAYSSRLAGDFVRPLPNRMMMGANDLNDGLDCADDDEILQLAKQHGIAID
jgi:hypothetical protein